MKINNRDIGLEQRGWLPDIFSTFLSRKHSYHRRIGKINYVKVKKEEKDGHKS
jgi:hypothetical protein